MNDDRRGRMLVGLTLAGAAIGLAVAALTPGPGAAVTPGPGFGPGPVTPADPVTPAWAEVVDLEPGIDPAAAEPCRAGRVECLDVVIAEMEARFERLGCAHTAPFAFTYLETTRDVRRRVADPDFFVDPPVISQLDAVFARLYFDAIDNWKAGRVDEVPGAWRIAFQAADEGRTSAAADVFLGMNAHISRDLAYAVALVASADGDMMSDPTDYLLVNEVIAEVQGPMLEGAAARFDPSLADLASLLPAEAGVSSVELIARWRQESFDLGIRLATAGSDEERAAVAAEIERNAVAGATMILNADSSLRPKQPPFDRDGYCESQR
jgi:hypothetical protein